MRVNVNLYRQSRCKKCKEYSPKPVFGKCLATRSDIYQCARKRIFQLTESE